MRKIQFTVDKTMRLRKFLEEKNISKRAINDLLKSGVFVNKKLKYKNIEVKPKDLIEITIEDEELDYEPIKGELDILYQDDNILVVNKSSGITVNSKNMENLSNHLAYYFLQNNIKSKIRLVNRLDMNTSGIMLVAKNKYAQSYYQKQIEENKLIKKYIAFVEKDLDIDEKFEIKLAYDSEGKRYIEDKSGQKAVTIFKTRQKYKNYSIIEAQILTGKTHQIRASLSYLKHPIIGDKLYGSTYDFLERFLLHSYRVEFKEFISQKNMILESNCDFSKYIDNIF